ncbi:MAG: hypothetical protein ACREQ4_18265 [Candidatus Binataceae bacterium]
MELRRLYTDEEKRLFTHNLIQARMTRGAGFSETKQSVIGEVHLAFGRLYALFDNEGPNPHQMIAGFVTHDLGSFSQSYPKPDLSQYPPETVFESGELWAQEPGAARLARHAGWILAGLFGAQALLVYPIYKPWNLSWMYKGFTRMGEPIEWPYARTLEGGKIHVQAMVLEGERLARVVTEAGACGFESLDGDRHFVFNNPYPVCNRPASLPREDRVSRELPGASPQTLAA